MVVFAELVIELHSEIPRGLTIFLDHLLQAVDPADPLRMQDVVLADELLERVEEKLPARPSASMAK
jgi:hypothetical protein